MTAETRFLIDFLSLIEGATVALRGFYASDKTITVKTEAMRADAWVEVCGRTVTIQPSAETIGTFRGYNWRVALYNAVKGAICDAEIANMETVIIWQNEGGGVETWLDIDRKNGEMTINENGESLTVQGIPPVATIARWQAQGFTD